MSNTFIVQETAGTLDFLRKHLPGWSRQTIKARLRDGCVRVNDVPVTQFDHPLSKGDVVTIGATAVRKAKVGQPAALEILYADGDLIAINKPAGLLSVGTTKETSQHAMAMLRHQLSRRSGPVRLWPVHRIDRDTSGVLLFATSREMREAVMATWGNAEKIYLAVVEGHPEPTSGVIDQPLREDDTFYRVHVGKHPDAKPALTYYKTEKITKKRALLRVHLVTGRQHQIRAHMAWLGNPVVGDPRYGVAGGRMGLHALSLKIVHPAGGQELIFTTPPPADFMALITRPALPAKKKKTTPNPRVGGPT
jgi:23S rRNA pseudouridine1911/1915/1917 synthase